MTRCTDVFLVLHALPQGAPTLAHSSTPGFILCTHLSFSGLESATVFFVFLSPKKLSGLLLWGKAGASSLLSSIQTEAFGWKGLDEPNSPPSANLSTYLPSCLC